MYTGSLSLSSEIIICVSEPLGKGALLFENVLTGCTGGNETGKVAIAHGSVEFSEATHWPS